MTPWQRTSGTVIVVPSLTFPPEELAKITGIEFYEQRMLFTLLLLSHPALRIVFVTSQRVEEPIIDYYLRFTTDQRDAGDRLFLIALRDAEPIALTSKLLRRPDALQRMRDLAGDDAILLTFNVTTVEGRLSTIVGVPLYGPHPNLEALGSKSGSRRVAREAGVAVTAGYEDLPSLVAVERALYELVARRSQAAAAVIKLNNGFSGQGNAIVELSALTTPLTDSPVTFCAEGESWRSFAAKIAAEGAVVEQLIRGPGVVSPSVQLRIDDDGSCEVVSTHDQLLGGPDDQVYLGCRFPARSGYRRLIHEAAVRVGEVLASKGVRGTFGIDFVVEPTGSGHDIHLSEINLRLGGTTHPFMMTSLLTDGVYDATSGELEADGRAKHYFATDNLSSEAYMGMEPADVIAAIDRAGIAFDRSTKTGVTLHLLGALPKHGKLGVLCIGDSRAEADELYEQAEGVVDGLARRFPSR